MSNHPPQPFATLMTKAEWLVEQLAPGCHRIEIAGSLRRRQAFCSDIEIVALAITVPNLLGEPSPWTELDLCLDTLPAKFSKQGQRYQQFTLNADDGAPPTQVDLFIQLDQSTWGMNFLIRTGNADFAKKMLTKRKWGGLRPDQYEHKDALVLYDGVVVPTPEEEDVFDLWHMAWIPPELRQWPLVGAKS